MSTAITELKATMKSLRLSEGANAIEDILLEAEQESITYRECLQRLFQYEIKAREERYRAKRLKAAAFPEYKPLESFVLEEQPSLSKKQFLQLKELLWVEQAYNILLLGPPGVGKTHLAMGLGVEAIEKGYKVSFARMDTLIHLLKTQEITRSSQSRLKKILSSELVIIDDVMFMAMDRNEGNLFFQLINKMYEQTSLIITSNKGPEDWGELLGDPAIATAILDRLVHKSEVIHLHGESYRIKHRQTIFGNR